jgi:hypothetical protein
MFRFSARQLCALLIAINIVPGFLAADPVFKDSFEGEPAPSCPCWDERNFQNTFPPTETPDHNWPNGCTAGYQGKIVLENFDKPFVGAPRFGIFQATVTTRSFPGVVNGCFFSNYADYYFGLYPELGEYRSYSGLTDEEVDVCVESMKRQARAHAIPGVAWDCWPE